MEKIYSVPVAAMDALFAKLAKLSKVAAKCGMPNFELKIVKDLTKVVDVGGGPKHVPYVMFTLDAAQPKLNGWSFLATINHTNQGNVVRALPDVEVAPGWDALVPYCDHCKWARRRKDSYIVMNPMGEVKQVGRSCLADYIGHANPHAIAKYAEQLIIAAEVCAVAHSNAEHQAEAISGAPTVFDPKTHPYLDTIAFVAKALQVIRADGWVSKRHALTTNKTPTATIVLQRFFSDMANPPTEDDFNMARQAILWVESLDPKSGGTGDDYYHTLHSVVGNGSGAFDHKHAPIVTSLAAIYPAEATRLIQEAKRSQSNVGPYIGGVGESVAFAAIVRSILPCSTRYFNGCVVKLEDEFGRVATIFMQLAKQEHNPMVLDNQVWVEGQVKKHSVYAGCHESVLAVQLIKSGASK